jgi:hypothetical protein
LKTKSSKKRQELLDIDAVMILLKEVLPSVFHQLLVNLVKEQIMGRVGSSKSTNSSSISDPRSLNKKNLSSHNSGNVAQPPHTYQKPPTPQFNNGVNTQFNPTAYGV